MSPFRLAAWPALVLVLAGLSRPAPAQERPDTVVLGVGPLVGKTYYQHHPASLDIGLEATLVKLNDRGDLASAIVATNYGLFAQLSTNGIGAGEAGDEGVPTSWHWRTALGVQAGIGGLGLEAGAAIETAAGQRSAGLAGHLAAYLSMGALSGSLRLGAPLAELGDARPLGGYGWEVAFIVNLKVVVFLRPGRVRVWVPFTVPTSGR